MSKVGTCSGLGQGYSGGALTRANEGAGQEYVCVRMYTCLCCEGLKSAVCERLLVCFSKHFFRFAHGATSPQAF